MQDNELFKLMKTETPYLPDAGFSDKVLRELPVQRRVRIRVLAASVVIASVLAFVIWLLGMNSDTFSALASPLALSTVAVAFWVFVGFFAFITVDEGVFEV